MANNSFDREILNARERPLSPDHNLAWSQLDQEVRNLLESQTLSRANSGTFPDAAKSPRRDGFLGDGFKVRANAAGANNLVFITAGLGFQDGTTDTNAPDTQLNIGGVSNLNDVSTLKPLVLSGTAAEAATGIAVPAAPGAGNSRIDIIEVRVNRLADTPTSRDVLDVGTGIFSPLVVNKNLSFLLDNTVAVVQQPDATTTAAIKYKKGVVSVTVDPTVPAVPATTPGYVKIAEIFVSGTNAVFDASLIKDMRPLLCPNGQMVVSCTVKLEKPGGNIQGTLTNVVAPPGVTVAAEGAADDTLRLYISPGVGWLTSTPGVGAGTVVAMIANTNPAQIATFGGVHQITFQTGDTQGGAIYQLLTAALAVRLSNPVFTNPAVLMAVNQPHIQIALQVTKFLVATGAPSTFSMSGGGNSWLMNVIVILNRG